MSIKSETELTAMTIRAFYTSEVQDKLSDLVLVLVQSLFTSYVQDLVTLRAEVKQLKDEKAKVSRNLEINQIFKSYEDLEEDVSPAVKEEFQTEMGGGKKSKNKPANKNAAQTNKGFVVQEMFAAVTKPSARNREIGTENQVSKPDKESMPKREENATTKSSRPSVELQKTSDRSDGKGAIKKKREIDNSIKKKNDELGKHEEGTEAATYKKIKDKGVEDGDWDQKNDFDINSSPRSPEVHKKLKYDKKPRKDSSNVDVEIPEGGGGDKNVADLVMDYDDYVKVTKSSWRQQQGGGIIKEEFGDLFEKPEVYSLVHCVAADMNMGSGIATTFRSKFKRVDELLQQRQKQGGLAYLKEGNRYIYYMVTKRESNGKPTYETFWKSLCKLRNKMVADNVKKLAMPRIGCGLDRLEWSDVKEMLEFVFKDTNIEVVVCNFQENHGKTKQKPKQIPDDRQGTKAGKKNKKKK